MGLDRGMLARIDRKLLAGLGQDEAFHMVRVPATEAKWSTWKRYCGAAGISMGRAISVSWTGSSPVCSVNPRRMRFRCSLAKLTTS